MCCEKTNKICWCFSFSWAGMNALVWPTTTRVTRLPATCTMLHRRQGHCLHHDLIQLQAILSELIKVAVGAELHLLFARKGLIGLSLRTHYRWGTMACWETRVGVTTISSATVRCHYNAINFLPNPHKRHLIARPLVRDMGCFLWFQTLIYNLPLPLQWCIQYHVKLDHTMMAPNCIFS